MAELISRTLEPTLKRMANYFRIIWLAGPRQSGKSTLTHIAFPEYKHVDLDDADLKTYINSDPRAFLKTMPKRLIIDEAQRAPHLFPALKIAVDEDQEPGRYILTGSQNYLLMQNISESLAGRVGLLELMPLSYQELIDAGNLLSVDEFMLKGGYPELFLRDLPLDVFFNSYIKTYVQRDVSNLKKIGDLALFQKFIMMLAHTVGSPLNVNSVARELGIDWHTAHNWLSVLERSYIVTLLRPYYKRVKRTLTRSPKLYFCDTGLLCHLLKINSLEALLTGKYLGHIFENLIVSETRKFYLNQGKIPELYYYRDDSKREIDLLDLSDAHSPRAIEIKAAGIYHEHFAQHLQTVTPELSIPQENRFVVLRNNNSYHSSGINIVSAHDYLRNNLTH